MSVSGNQIHKNLLYVANNDRLIDGLSGWLKDPIYFNLSDIGFVSYLTLSPKTDFRLFQTKRVCKRQFQA